MSTEASWRRYPNLEAAIDSESPAVLAAVECTRAEIASVSRTGGPREKDRARTALAAYERVLELYRHLTQVRDQM